MIRLSSSELPDVVAAVRSIDPRRRDARQQHDGRAALRQRGSLESDCRSGSQLRHPAAGGHTVRDSGRPRSPAAVSIGGTQAPSRPKAKWSTTTILPCASCRWSGIRIFPRSGPACSVGWYGFCKSSGLRYISRGANTNGSHRLAVRDRVAAGVAESGDTSLAGFAAVAESGDTSLAGFAGVRRPQPPGALMAIPAAFR